tara:strand:+ start:3196 stop:4113 length:918 start_codon:yes stop_codon:yes gene_type:complete
MSVQKSSALNVKKKYLSFIKSQEILGEPFYNKIEQLNKFYLPICKYIFESYKFKKKTMIIGLSGGQGTGKTTIGNILKIILKHKYDLRVINFSIDDFYNTLKERKIKSKNIHKLFLTRGVPGTHDTNLLKKSFKNFKKKPFKPFFIPKFNKATDDRCPKNKWNRIIKKPDIILFEGWCVGAKPQKNKNLIKSVNSLENSHDENLKWRKTVNNELKNSYKSIFKFIEKLIFLKVPNFKYVYKWRLLQEKKLKLKQKGKKIMSKYEVKNFIMFYERITRQMIKDLNSKANVVISIDKKHKLKKLKIN